MKCLIINWGCSAWLLVIVFIFSPWRCQVLAEGEKLDAQVFLPLFERNSIARKVLDVSYSFVCGADKKEVHLVFDTESGKYYEQEKIYESFETTDVYRLNVVVWDSREYMRWVRHVSEIAGSRVLGSGVYEDPGQVLIKSRGDKIPYFAEIFYDTAGHAYTKSVLQRDPQIVSLSDSTIAIETTANKFEFSKNSGALVKLVSYTHSKNGKKNAWITRELSGHIEQSGVWIPLRIVAFYYGVGKTPAIVEISVDPKTLRLVDTPDNSIFSITMPTGCTVQDEVRKTTYTVTTLDTDPPQDVKALQQMLEQMLEQAEEQKEAVEQEMKQRK